eukprot:57677_1
MATVSAWVICILTIILGLLSYPLSWLFYSNICAKETTPNVSKNDGKQNKLAKRINMVSITAFTCFVISVNFNMIAHIIYIVGYIYIFNIFNGMAAFIFVFGMHLLLFIFVLRIDYTFSNSLSIFAYNSITMKLLYIAPIFLLCLVLMVIIIEAQARATGKLAVLRWATTIVYCVIFVVVWITFVVLLIQKTIVLINYKLDDEKNNNDACAESTGIDSTSPTYMSDRTESNNDNQVIIDIMSIDLITRYSLLIIIAFITTIVTVFSGLLFVYLEPNKQESWVVSFEGFVNAFCIVLFFGFSSQLYYKLCHHPDKWLKTYFVSKIITKGTSDKDKQHLKQLLFRN